MQWHFHRVALCALIPDWIWKCWYLWTENPEKNPWSKNENQQQTQPTYIWQRDRESNLGHIGVRREWSHHCAIPAPPKIGISISLHSPTFRIINHILKWARQGRDLSMFTCCGRVVVCKARKPIQILTVSATMATIRNRITSLNISTSSCSVKCFEQGRTSINYLSSFHCTKHVRTFINKRTLRLLTLHWLGEGQCSLHGLHRPIRSKLS